MNNFIFKSANRLIKNSPITIATVIHKLELILVEQRMQRSDLRTVSQKLDKLLIDKHLQMQVDEYFTEDNMNNIPEEKQDLD